MSHDGATAHYHVITMCVELRTQDLDIGDTSFPKSSEQLADEHMLYDALSQCGMGKMSSVCFHGPEHTPVLREE